MKRATPLSVIFDDAGVDKANVNISVEEDVLNVEGQLAFSKYQKLAPVYRTLAILPEPDRSI